MLCKSCFNKIKDQDFYCRNCGMRTPKIPLEGEKLWTPVNIIEKKEEIKVSHKKYYIFAFVILGMFLLVIIYLIILIIRNKV